MPDKVGFQGDRPDATDKRAAAATARVSPFLPTIAYDAILSPMRNHLNKGPETGPAIMLLPEPARAVSARPFFLHQGLRATV